MGALDISTDGICNNNCRFCQSRGIVNLSFQRIREILEASLVSNDEAIISGSMIREDFLSILSLARSLGYKKIQVRSNGRMFSSRLFCAEVIKAGATRFIVSIHGANEAQHDYLTRSSGSFRQSVIGVQNLKAIRALVGVETMVVRENVRDLEMVAKLVAKLGADSHEFKLYRQQSSLSGIEADPVIASHFLGLAFRIAGSKCVITGGQGGNPNGYP